MNFELGTSCKLAPAGVLNKGTQIAITSKKAAKLIKCID